MVNNSEIVSTLLGQINPVIQVQEMKSKPGHLATSVLLYMLIREDHMLKICIITEAIIAHTRRGGQSTKVNMWTVTAAG